jgi:rSAM/selenodomain-associated transferase 1
LTTKRCAVGVMARAPSSGGKSRLGTGMSPSRLTALRAALVADTLDVVGRAADLFSFDTMVFVTPRAAADEILDLSDRPWPSARQSDGDLGERMRSALAYLIDGGAMSAILVGTDIPLLSVAHLAAARDLLETSGGVVLGPADDGGYFLVGMQRVHAELFDGVEWGTASVLTDTLRVADRLGIEVRMVGGCYDVDTMDDLRRLEQDLASAAADVAPHMRAWFSAR